MRCVFTNCPSGVSFTHVHLIRFVWNILWKLLACELHYNSELWASGRKFMDCGWYFINILFIELIKYNHLWIWGVQDAIIIFIDKKCLLSSYKSTHKLYVYLKNIVIKIIFRSKTWHVLFEKIVVYLIIIYSPLFC